MILVECIIQTGEQRITNRYTASEWPTEMAARPLKGDSVESKDGGCILQVLNVTHVTRKNSHTKYPALKVHLGL
jgi:hypothetical protein